MKRFMTLIIIFVATYSTIMCMEDNNAITAPSGNSRITISYAPAIPATAKDLSTIRSKLPEEKVALFKQMPTDFPLKEALERINKLKNPQIVLWFTNYFGSVTDKSVDWYKKNIFKKITKATFWLTDLKAWGFLSVDKEQLKKSYRDLVTKLEQNQELTPEECPLTSQRSRVVDEDINKIPNCRLLSAQSYFDWLSNCDDPALFDKDTGLLNDDICDKLCLDSPRLDSLPYSLSAMGFRSKLLNRVVKKYKEKKKSNLLDVEYSLVYPHPAIS